MKKEDLQALGLDDSQIKGVMVKHGETLNATKQELLEAQQAKQALETQVNEMTQSLADATSKAEKGSEMATQLEALQSELDDNKAKGEAKLLEVQMGYELDAALTKGGALNSKATKALLDMDAIKFDDGKLTGLDEQLETVKKDNPYLFQEVKTDPVPKFLANGNPNPDGGNDTTMAQRIAARMSNQE